MPSDTRSWIAPPLARRALTDPRALLDLPGEIVGGHPDRHVVRVVLGTGRGRIVAYLKREHRVPIRERVANACAGFGLVSNSVREARTLEQLRAAGVAAPRVLAYGECDGRAFVLVRALRGYGELREFLRADVRPDWQRRLLARRLGRLLARVHAAGFDMPDLLCKHVMIHRRTLRPALIDWARSRRRRRLPAETRIRDLAMLHASLASELATPRERLTCLRAYLRAGPVRTWADAIRGVGAVLAGRRTVRESYHRSGPIRSQRLRWVAGDESLCVTNVFWRRGRGQIPEWLRAATDGSGRPRAVIRRWLGEKVFLRRTPPLVAWRRFLLKLSRRRVVSAAVRDAGLNFRLERFGVRVPRLLAFGGRPDGAGFLLTRPIPDTVSLRTWLASPHKRRNRILLRIGRLVRRLHDAGCSLTDQPDVLHVRADGRGLVVPDVRGVRIKTLRTDAARSSGLHRVLRTLRIKPESADAELVRRGYGGKHTVVRRPMPSVWS
jgi:tRNA A-37 threonylcarbamoyl transferase component Bud32